MKTILKMLATVFLVSALTGCAAQKPTEKAEATKTKTEVLHEQVLQAIEARKFIIKSTGEFTFPDDRAPAKYATNGYISLQDSKAIFRLPKEVFRRSPFEHLNITDKNARFTMSERKKNGDLNFSIKIEGEKSYLQYEVLLTLYNNTNQCYVQINNGYAGNRMVSFRAEIDPYYE